MEPSDQRPMRVMPSLVLTVAAVIGGLLVLNWVIGTIFSIIRMVLIVGIAIAVIWALASARADR